VSNYTIRAILIFGILVIIGIISLQFGFVHRSYKQEDKQLDRSIRITLQNTAEKLSAYHEGSLPYDNIIHQYSSNYYVVNINNIIDVKVLEYYLVKEFERRNLKLDFEYAIYDCATDEMVYGNYVKLSDKEQVDREMKEFPKYDEYIYYFGIYFPNKKHLILENLSVWYFISSILFVVIIFFAYSMFVILKQKRLSEIQKDFIHNITHEFKTPLTSISLSADVLSEKDIITEPDRLEKYARIIKEQATHLHDQVLRVLQFSNNENLRARLKPTTIDLKEFIYEILNGFELRFKNENVQVDIDKAKGKLSVSADKTHLKNVIINIIDNALKYSGTNPKINISLFKVHQYIILSIKDNGEGIDKKYSKKVFEKFFRIPTGNIHNVKGFGLGLSYVKSVAKAHKWKLHLISEKNRGTEIKISFNKSL